MAGLQEAIHKLETGGGPRGVRFGVGVLVLGLLVFLYNWRGFHTLSNPEAMDAAQLARNLAQGKGYTTSCIRPWSMHLLKARDEQLHGPPAPGAPADSSRLKRPHPDLANPPAYPVVLAGLMKVLPFRYEMRASPSPFWNPGGIFRRYQPDFVIALFNQLLFFTAATALFFFARRYFDPAVAWLSTLVFLGTELLWRFSMSG